MPQLDVASFSSQIFWLFLCYGVLYFFVSKFLVPKLGRLLDERESIISGNGIRLERIKAETKKFEAEYLASLNHAFKSSSLKIAEQKAHLEKDILLQRASKEVEVKNAVDEANKRLNSFKKSSDKIMLEMTVDIIENILKNMSIKSFDRSLLMDRVLDAKFSIDSNR